MVRHAVVLEHEGNDVDTLTASVIRFPRVEPQPPEGLDGDGL